MKLIEPGVLPAPRPPSLPWIGVYRCDSCGARWELGPEDRDPPVDIDIASAGVPPEDLAYAVRCPTCGLTKLRYTQEATLRSEFREHQRRKHREFIGFMTVEILLLALVVYVLIGIGMIR